MEESIVQNPQVIKSKSPLKYLFLAFIVVSLFFAGYYFGSTTEKKPATAPAVKNDESTITYKHLLFHIGTSVFQTKMPKNWMVRSVDKTNGTTTVSFGEPHRELESGVVSYTQPAIEITFARSKKLAEKDLSQWTEDEMIDFLIGSSELTWSDTIVGGLPAKKTSTLGQACGTEIALVRQNDLIFAFAHSCDYEKYKEFQTILKEFKIIVTDSELISSYNPSTQISTPGEELNKMESGKKLPE